MARLEHGGVWRMQHCVHQAAPSLTSPQPCALGADSSRIREWQPQSVCAPHLQSCCCCCCCCTPTTIRLQQTQASGLRDMPWAHGTSAVCPWQLLPAISSQRCVLNTNISMHLPQAVLQANFSAERTRLSVSGLGKAPRAPALCT